MIEKNVYIILHVYIYIYIYICTNLIYKKKNKHIAM